MFYSEHDNMSKDLIYSCFEDEEECSINTSVSVDYEDKIIIKNKEENLDEMVKKYLKLPTKFKSDSAIVFKDLPNVVFIFEFDEGGDFHSDFENPVYTKKTLTYNHMISHNKPEDNTSFVITRITYSSNINKGFLRNKIFTILEYINKYHSILTTALLGSGYILFKLTKNRALNIALIDKEEMTKFIDEDNINLMKIYEDATRIVNGKIWKENVLRIKPIPYESIENDVHPPLAIIRNIK